MKRISLIAAIGMLSCMLANGQASEALKVKTFTLDNGLTVWINEDPGQVAVYGAVVVKAGAVDCPGTGIAHYFEHMMFKGTDKIGTTDYAAEKVYLDSIAVKYDELATLTDDAARKDIQMEINRLSIKAADYAIPNEFNNLVSAMGGSSLNAFTSYDETVYHNKFLPEYFEQWAELNSERIMNPVFRLFQSELETVYEEKNRSDDNLVSDLRKAMLENIFAGTGYTDEIIGTTDNLKNPRLSQMREFFEKYYVASNMGLILTGNIDAEAAMPVIKKTFGRIRRGEVPERAASVLTPINGCKEVPAMVNMPIVKINALCFRGPSKRDEDFLGVSLLTSMLNNDAGTGLLDKLTVDHKVMMAQAMPDLSFKNAGSITVLFVPKVIVQSNKKATKLVLKAFERLKEGDFSDEYFESCKLSLKKQLISDSELLENRMQNMAFAFSDELDWNDVLQQPAKLDELTKEDIVALARKYFGDDYVFVKKMKGTAVRDNLAKPDYEKVVPKNKEASSAYAKALLASAEGIKVVPKAIDYENAAEITRISDGVKLYSVGNPYNDVFNFTMTFETGTNEIPALDRVATYVNLLGTGDKSFDELHSELQTMGSSIAFSAGANSFDVILSGFDSHLDETLAITADLLKNIKGDKKKVANCKSDEKSGIIMNRSDMDALSEALMEKAYYGDNSIYTADKGEWSDEALLGLFRDIQKKECDMTYSGTIDAGTVASYIRKHFDVDACVEASNIPVDFTPVHYDSPQVFFVDKKDAAQSIIFSFVPSDPVANEHDRIASTLFATYLGGGMSSLLFQEIREFRSMAYAAQAGFRRPTKKSMETVPAAFLTYVGTQADKTVEAMEIVDSLVSRTPFLAAKIDMVRKEMLNNQCNQYPSFRSIADVVAYDKRCGYEVDPVDVFMQVIDEADPASMEAIWKKYVEGRDHIWCIVGNSSKLDMDAISKFGPVTTLKAADIIK